MGFLDLSIVNFYSKRNNNELLPNSIRGCIIGESGCGKTNSLMNLLLQDYLDYNNLYIFSTNLHQLLYQISIILTVFTLVKITLNYQKIQLERMPTSLFYFHKINKI